MRTREKVQRDGGSLKAERMGDLVDLIELGAWPFDAVATIGWRFEYAIEELRLAAHEHADDEEGERYRHARTLMMEARERYAEATGSPHPMITRERYESPEVVERRNRARQERRRTLGRHNA